MNVKVGVLRLHDPPSQPVVIPGSAELESENSDETQKSYEDKLIGFSNCLRHLSETQYSHDGPHTATETTFSDEQSDYFGENGGKLKGKRFSLYCHGHVEWRENCHFVRVREHTCKPSLELPRDGDINRKWHNSIIPSDAPIYDVEIRGKDKDTVETKMDLTISVDPNKEFDTEFIVIQQIKGNSHWNDITKKCTMAENALKSVVITIPIEKSSKVWVVRVKRSLCHLVDVLLALFFGQVLFRILIFCKVEHDEVHLRIIGVNEELYPVYPVREVGIATESGFQMVEASNAKQLIKKGKLLVSFKLSGNCQRSVYFDLGKASKVGQREDFKFTIGDLECIPRIEVQTANEAEVLWSYDVKNIINKYMYVELCPRNNNRPAFASLDDELNDEAILWLAHHVNKDWENLGVCLGIEMVEQDIIKADDTRHVVRRCESMLHLWQKKVGNKATWRSLQEALEKPVVGRFDIFRNLQLEESEIISDNMLLELASKVGRSWKTFGHCLNIPDEVIEIIDSNEQGVVGKCKRLLQKWRQGKNPSMEQLVNALREPVMKQNELAEQLENSSKST